MLQLSGRCLVPLKKALGIRVLVKQTLPDADAGPGLQFSGDSPLVTRSFVSAANVRSVSPDLNVIMRAKGRSLKDPLRTFIDHALACKRPTVFGVFKTGLIASNFFGQHSFRCS